MKVELSLSNYATKSDLKNAAGDHTSKFAKKVDLASLKPEVDKIEKVPIDLNSLKGKVDKLDVDKLILAPDDLSKLSDVVKNDVVKKYVYNAKIKDIEDKIPYMTDLATNSTLNAKINEVKKKIPSLYVLIMSRTRFRVNPHSIVA